MLYIYKILYESKGSTWIYHLCGFIESHWNFPSWGGNVSDKNQSVHLDSKSSLIKGVVKCEDSHNTERNNAIQAQWVTISPSAYDWELLYEWCLSLTSMDWRGIILSLQLIIGEIWCEECLPF